MDDVGGLSEQAFADLSQLAQQLRAVSAVPDPIVQQQRVQGRWETLFAHFGARHSAGKTRVHDSDLRTHTFSQFRPVPVRITRLCQEITAVGHAGTTGGASGTVGASATGGASATVAASAAGGAYNNVVSFEALDAAFSGHIVIRGRFRPDPDGNLQRFMVAFERAELHPAGPADEVALRERLGLAADAPLARDFKSPKLHSDVIYLDDDTRLNAGGYGGLYVLRRLAEPGISVTFA
jgi:hypothetical protein